MTILEGSIAVVAVLVPYAAIQDRKVRPVLERAIGRTIFGLILFLGLICEICAGGRPIPPSPTELENGRSAH